MKKILIVAYHFPPIVTTGTFRTMAWVTRLLDRGWKVSVLTTSNQTDNIEENFAHTALKHIRIYRVKSIDLIDALKQFLHADTLENNFDHKNPIKMAVNIPRKKGNTSFKDFATHLLKIPDKYLGWFFKSLPLIFNELRKEKFDVIYSTSPFMTSHLIALATKIISGGHWVADFRDPWVDNPFRTLPGRMLNTIDRMLEKMVVTKADRVVCVTPNMVEGFKRRYPEKQDSIYLVSNGYDPDEFTGNLIKRDYSDDEFVITHAGVFYGPRSPLPILKALQWLKTKNRSVARKIRLQLIGNPDYQGGHLADICENYDIQDMVKILPYMPKKDLIPYLKGSDCLLLMGFVGENQDIQLTGKIFDYLAVGKPILAVAPAKTDIDIVLGKELISSEMADPRDIEKIAEKLERMSSKNYPAGQRSRAYEWGNLFQSLENILDQTDGT